LRWLYRCFIFVKWLLKPIDVTASRLEENALREIDVVARPELLGGMARGFGPSALHGEQRGPQADRNLWGKQHDA
jgi:hypothetical protein